MARRWSSVLSYVARNLACKCHPQNRITKTIQVHTFLQSNMLPVPIPCLLYSIRMRSTEPTARLVAERNFPLGVITPTLPTSSGVFYWREIMLEDVKTTGV